MAQPKNVRNRGRVHAVLDSETKTTFKWRRVIYTTLCDLGHGHKAVMTALSHFMDNDTGVTYVSQLRVAEESNCSRATVIAAIKEAKKKGWLAELGQRNKDTKYYGVAVPRHLTAEMVAEALRRVAEDDPVDTGEIPGGYHPCKEIEHPCKNIGQPLSNGLTTPVKNLDTISSLSPKDISSNISIGEKERSARKGEGKAGSEVQASRLTETPYYESIGAKPQLSGGPSSYGVGSGDGADIPVTALREHFPYEPLMEEFVDGQVSRFGKKSHPLGSWKYFFKKVYDREPFVSEVGLYMLPDENAAQLESGYMELDYFDSFKATGWDATVVPDGADAEELARAFREKYRDRAGATLLEGRKLWRQFVNQEAGRHNSDVPAAESGGEDGLVDVFAFQVHEGKPLDAEFIEEHQGETKTVGKWGIELFRYQSR